MPREPLLDFDVLLAPIEGDNPAGEPPPFEIKEKLEEARVEIDPQDFPEDDPMRPDEPKWADWRAIVRLASDTLASKSKDLLVAARLIEAMVKEHGFAGLRDALHLMRRLVDEAWDRINPGIEDGDVEVRAGPFNWLDDADRGARFPNTLRTVPLFFGEHGPVSCLDWRKAQDGTGKLTTTQVEQTAFATSIDEVRATAEELAGSLEELTALRTLLDSKMGEYSPGLTGIGGSLEEVRSLVKQTLHRMAPDEEEGEAPSGGSGPSKGSSSLATRADAYRQLAQAAALLRQLEPHSPVPYLIERAVELGKLPFPMLIRALVREPTTLGELSREFGLKEPEAPPSSTEE